VAFRKKDYEEYRHVLEVPDEEIEGLAPKARSHFKEDIFSAIEGAINVVNMLSSMRKEKEEYLEEDEWMEIDR
jgi:inhibitor of KinA sporulation pathway (predicted exonuclease)